MSGSVIKPLKFIVDYRKKIIMSGCITTLQLSLLVLVSDMQSKSQFKNPKVHSESCQTFKTKFLQKQFTVESCLLFSQITPSWMFNRVLNTSLKSVGKPPLYWLQLFLVVTYWHRGYDFPMSYLPPYIQIWSYLPKSSLLNQELLLY